MLESSEGKVERKRKGMEGGGKGRNGKLRGWIRKGRDGAGNGSTKVAQSDKIGDM